MPEIPELGGIGTNTEDKVSEKHFDLPWIPIIVVAAITLFFVIQLDHVIQSNFNEPIEPIIEFVDRNVFVEVPIFSCPTDFNAIIQTTCVEFGGLVSPITQEALEEIRNNGGVCEVQETEIVCQPCLRIEQIGWSCISNGNS